MKSINWKTGTPTEQGNYLTAGEWFDDDWHFIPILHLRGKVRYAFTLTFLSHASKGGENG